ncbi:MAG: hypothetical protein RL088_1884 [Verrucomicrobiota bacterium]|jgi:hypothetical protein
MSDAPSKYAENQFDTATQDNASLMSEILADVMPRITAAAAIHSELIPARDLLVSMNAAWDAAETVLANAEAGQIGATAAFENKLLSLTRKPDPDTNSPLDTWDITIAGQAAYGSPLYKTLLPHGRETLTAGTYLQRLDALNAFRLRLTAQVAKPALVALGATVLAFYNQAVALRNTQNDFKTDVDNARTDQEGVRKLCAAALYGMVGLGQWVFRNTPALVDTLYDVNILRDPAQTKPAAPADTSWNPATLTLATTVPASGATRYEAWRQGPGGTPELLAVGERGALSVQIPANITFDAGDTYQLWLQSRNSRGSSGPGPKTTWQAP